MMFVTLTALCLPACTAPASPARSNAPNTVTPLPQQPLALLSGQAITAPALQSALLETAGGQVLLEYTLDRQLESRLSQLGLTITDTDIEAEQSLLLQTLASNPDQAQRTLNQLRTQRGLGNTRYRQLLWRNAAMRRMIREQVTISDAAVLQAFAQRYGPRFETRLIVTDTLTLAGDISRRARAGESFIDLAIAHSSDASKAQGGLLPPINLQDPTYPAAVRQVVGQMQVGDVSDPVALDRGFAILKLERKIEGADLKSADVKEELETIVSRQLQQMLMQRLAREMILQSNLVIMDPALSKSFAQAKAALLAE